MPVRSRGTVIEQKGCFRDPHDSFEDTVAENIRPQVRPAAEGWEQAKDETGRPRLQFAEPRRTQPPKHLADFAAAFDHYADFYRSHMLLEEPGGGTRKVLVPAGTAYRKLEGVEHNVVNDGALAMIFVETELK